MSKITYFDLFWVFMIGNISGVIIEALWCKLRFDKYEIHNVTIYGPFNIVYGIGFSVFFVISVLFKDSSIVEKFLISAVAGSMVELACGLIIRIGIGMKAWDYRKHFLNYRGMISFAMFIVWGAVGLGFIQLVSEPLQKLLKYISKEPFQTAAGILTIFMVINLILTAAGIIRWAMRHHGSTLDNRLLRWLDRIYPDERMEKRFFYWSFIDEETT